MVNTDTIVYILLNSEKVPTKFSEDVKQFLIAISIKPSFIVTDNSDFSNSSDLFKVNGVCRNEKVFLFSISLKRMIIEALNIDANIKFLAIVNLEEIFQSKCSFEYLNVDFSLPNDYLYFTFDSKTDFGYSSKLIWGTVEVIKEFLDFNSFVLECLINSNNYLSILTLDGWPISNKESKLKKILDFSANRIIRSDIANSSILKIFIDKIKSKLKRYLIRNESSVELYGNRFAKYNLCTFDKSVCWEIRPALKLFCINKKLRNKIRFITSNDFNSIIQ